MPQDMQNNLLKGDGCSISLNRLIVVVTTIYLQNQLSSTGQNPRSRQTTTYIIL